MVLSTKWGSVRAADSLLSNSSGIMPTQGRATEESNVGAK
jgi:hypothetical protein